LTLIVRHKRRGGGAFPSTLPLAALLLLSLPLTARPAQAPDSGGAPLSVLTVGGGPEPRSNQVAIESNVRYVDRLLPQNTALKRILFGDGKGQDPIVQYRDEGEPPSEAEQAFRVLFGQSTDNARIRYRKPELPVLNGASNRASLSEALKEYVSEPAGRPLLVYFTGHGNQNRQDNDNNTFALWGERGLTVRELSQQLETLPPARPVVVVMVQCYSGAFGNLIFEGGAPTNPLQDRPICGFFATTRERVAAGCTPAVNEADYDDFTSYFFAGLTGTTRVGKRVSPPDYNKDGRVGMDEAFAYALITEPSADVPVATSDVFLRRFVPMSDDDFVQVPFSRILALASPAQRAVLESLSSALGLSGEDRLKGALQKVRDEVARGGPEHAHEGEGSSTAAEGAAKLAEMRRSLTRRFTGLRGRRDEATFAQAREAAVKYLGEHKAERDEILKVARSRQSAASQQYQAQLRGARYLRLLRTAKSVVLEDKLRNGGGDAALVARFDALKKLEAGNPLAPATAALARHEPGKGSAANN
jgi:hypothetical protein